MIFDIIGQVVIGWLLADLLSGIFHWWQDRWPSASNCLIGSYLIAPSRLHHQKPSVFTEGSFMYRNGATFVGVGIIAVPLLILIGLNPLSISIIVGGLITTQVHYLSHCPSRVNRMGKILQAVGIIQSPKHHAVHHRPPHSGRYCILTDYINPILDDLKVWDLLEFFLIRMNIKLSFGQ